MISVSVYNNNGIYFYTQTGHQSVNVSDFYINSAMSGMTSFNLTAAPS